MAPRIFDTLLFFIKEKADNPDHELWTHEEIADGSGQKRSDKSNLKVVCNKLVSQLVAVLDADPHRFIKNRATVGYEFKSEVRILGPREVRSLLAIRSDAERSILAGSPSPVPDSASSVSQAIDKGGGDTSIGFGRLYRVRGQCADAFRLAGADSEFFPADCVHVQVDPTPYEMPLEIRAERKAILKQLEIEAKRQGRMFFNGPHTRLVDFRVTPRDRTEQKHLELTLGPISWHDYSVVNEVYAQTLRQAQSKSLEQLINLEEVADGCIRNVRLTNIACTDLTLVTADGYAMYSRRSRRVAAAQGLFASAVAENINQDFDRSLRPQKRGDLPAPFRAVLRGVAEEISPNLREHLNPNAILLLGLAFNLRNLHPDILFLAATLLNRKAVLELATDFPGKDFVEGNLLSVNITSDSRQLDRILSARNWLPAGKACLMRSIEFLDAIRREKKVDLHKTINRLANGDIDWFRINT